MKHEASKCFYNKKYKGWRPSTICKEMNIPFKHRQELSSDMGGFTSSVEESSNSKDSNSSTTSNSKNE